LTDDAPLHLPLTGDYQLRILDPNLLELRLITTKASGAPVGEWNFADTNGQLSLPAAGALALTVDGREAPVVILGFKRRVLYAPLTNYDLRIENCLYLNTETAIHDNQTVEVSNSGGTLWPATTHFVAVSSPRRFSPAIHVNQAGYAPDLPKKAMVGYFLGGAGEMPITVTNFQIVDAATGAAVFQGGLVPRRDLGYTYTPLPYQKVLEADFSALTNRGEFKLVVPGMGASYPFFVDDGVPAAFARAYELGLYHQRCGAANVLPYTRFTHDPCHTAPAAIPLPLSSFTNTWRFIADYGSRKNADNPPQTAPLLTSPVTLLYPFIKTGTLDVSGGHHDAGDYSKYTINSAKLIHCLVFAADSLPGVGDLDNLGIPESGDGKSDVLEEAKWEADYLLKLQDTDGGFYFLVYPRDREYENNVTPDHGDPQVVWPKNTAVTAAAVAALAQCSSSPRFKAQFPRETAAYFAAAQRGWTFLANAIEAHGKAGAYQKLTAYGDEFTHDDELAWAACELFLATGDRQYQDRLLEWFPDPSDPKTCRWGWWRLYACYGNAIRSYAFAASSGRLSRDQLNPKYLAACEREIEAGARDQLLWSRQCAYGSSFPTETKRFRGGGWYFSMDQAFDLAVACALGGYPPMNDPRAKFLEAIVANMNYEGGGNPVNVCFVEGLGWRRQRDIVDQYAQNDRRVLPPSGIPVGNIQASFDYLWDYHGDLRALSYPSDSATTAPYPFYDRWGDSFNVQTEPVVVNQARALAAAAFLMAQTGTARQSWQSARARNVGPATPGGKFTVAVDAPDFDPARARIVWEAPGREPVYGREFSPGPIEGGPRWIEVEVQMPDGRRAFAATVLAP